MSIPDSPKLKVLKNKKIKKYMWVVEALAKSLMKKLPTNAQVEYEDIYLAGLSELTVQITRIYDNPELVKKYWNDKKGDVTIGPFFLKGLNSPYPQAKDPGSMKYIKGRMLDELAKSDPAPRNVRKKIKMVNEFTKKYQNTFNRKPPRRVLRNKFGFSSEELEEILDYMNPNELW